MGNSLKDQHYKNMDIRLQMDTLTFEAECLLLLYGIKNIVNIFKV